MIPMKISCELYWTGWASCHDIWHSLIDQKKGCFQWERSRDRCILLTLCSAISLHRKLILLQWHFDMIPMKMSCEFYWIRWSSGFDIIQNLLELKHPIFTGRGVEIGAYYSRWSGINSRRKLMLLQWHFNMIPMKMSCEFYWVGWSNCRDIWQILLDQK